MRLFTALWPPPAAVDALATELASAPPWHPDGAWRPVDPGSWHLTLCFHGDDDPDARAAALDAAFAGVPAPRLRIAGTGTFPGVVWAGVEPGGVLDDLAARAGADPSSFRAHLTLARRRPADRPRPDALTGAGGVRPGPWWTADEVLLVRSDPGPRYTPVHRVRLTVPSGGAGR